MRQSLRYTNKNGVVFDIVVENAPVPSNADYFGFVFRVKDCDLDRSTEYRVIIMKTKCPSTEQAKLFVMAEPLIFLKSAFLETYVNGIHPILRPDLSPGWVVV